MLEMISRGVGTADDLPQRAEGQLASADLAGADFAGAVVDKLRRVAATREALLRIGKSL